MILFTKEIEKKLKAQYPKGNNLSTQNVICKIFNPIGAYTAYIMNQDPRHPDYLWGIFHGNEITTGSILKSELTEYKGLLGIGLERDLYFKPRKAIDVWNALQKGEHI